MKRTLLIVSIGTLLVVGVAVAGQALVVTQGIYYTPSGQPANPTPLALVATFMAGAGSALSMPLCMATAILGLVIAGMRQQYRWIMAILGACLLSMVGLFGMAWILLSANSPVAFVTPLALIVLVTLLYGLRLDSDSAGSSYASARGTP
jgi:hypothetical protein